MGPRDEWLNQAIERGRLNADDADQTDGTARDDPEVLELASLARALQSATPPPVEPEFARHLEQRMLAYNATLRRQIQRRLVKGRGAFLPPGLRQRFWFETGLATVTGGLFVVTLFWHDWIEIILHVDPDQGSGLLEWSIVGALLMVTMNLIILARYEWRRTLAATP
jgi:hypothetical protein